MKPICGSCKRHGADCVYLEVRPQNVSSGENSESTQPRRRQSKVAAISNKSPSPTADLFPRILTELEDPEIPESKARRLMELRLMSNSLLNMDAPTDDNTSTEWLTLWRTVVPQLSLEHDSVLYALFALSATHILRSDRDDQAVYSARQNYLVLALREQRKEVADIRPSNADAVCLTSVLILRNSFAMLQERNLDTYTPPCEWLKMGRGAGAVMWKANAAISPEIPASFKMFLESYQVVFSEQQQQREFVPPFSNIYNTILSQEPSIESRNIYRQTLAYINCMQLAIDNHEPSYVVGRRLQAFPMVIPTRFIDLVEALEPFALVVLACYFGVAAQLDDQFWWLRGTGQDDRTSRREVLGIFGKVGERFRGLLSWAVMRIELQYVRPGRSVSVTTA